MTLKKGKRYDVAALTLVGWTKGNGSGHAGYSMPYYFENGIYLGPDQDGIEPIFEELPAD
jgi:hypothetical protein